MKYFHQKIIQTLGKKSFLTQFSSKTFFKNTIEQQDQTQTCVGKATGCKKTRPCSLVEIKKHPDVFFCLIVPWTLLYKIALS